MLQLEHRKQSKHRVDGNGGFQILQGTELGFRGFRIGTPPAKKIFIPFEAI